MSIISLSGKLRSGKDTAGSMILYLTSECSDKDGKHYRTFDEWLRKGQGNNDMQTWYNSDWKVKKWASTLRKVTALLLGMDEDFTYTDEFKAMTLPEEWDHYTACESCVTALDAYVTEDLKCSNCGEPAIRHQMTGRYFLQVLGTDAIRDGLHTNAWVNSLMSGYKKCGRCVGGCERSVENGVPGYECISDSYCYNSQYPNWIITDTRFPNELKAVKDKGGITIKVERPGLVSADTHPSETALDNATFDYVVVNDGSLEDLLEKVRDVLVREGILSHQ